MMLTTALRWIPGMRARVGMLGLLAALANCGARAATQPPAVLPAETTDAAVLPPAGPHRVFVMGWTTGGANVIDGDSADLGVLGLVSIAETGVLALSHDAERIFVIETFYSHGNRGTREDVLSIYDGRSLALLKEIPIPGRLVVVPKPQVFAVSDDDHLAYVYDMVPTSSVHVIDLQEAKVVASVYLPGCALAFPYGPRAFGTICGDGTVGTVQVPRSGEAKAVFSKPFFDANTDPLFESSVVDPGSGAGWFMTFTGKVFPAQLAGATPVISKPWSVSEAAGLPPVGTGLQELAWRPGGGARVLALHRATKRLFVLMHPGNYWTHKEAGTEVWVLDAARQTLVRRIKLEAPARGIAVSQDASPLLYAVSDDGGEGELAVIDASSGEKLRKRKLPGGFAFAWVPGG